MMPAIDEVMLTVSSSLAASIVVKATVFLALGLIGASMARNSRAAMRHVLLAATLGMLLVLPVASLVGPPVRIVVSAATHDPVPLAFSGATRAIPVATQFGVAGPAPEPRISMNALLLVAWMAGMALFLAPVLMGMWQVRSLRRSALPWPDAQAVAGELALHAGIRRRVDVLLHQNLQGPMTCGAWHPAIVLPQEAQSWDAENLHRAIVHELEHVRRGDWVIQCVARAVCALYWFHPLVWMAWRRLILEAERSCDDAVLERSEATAYADQLIGLAARLSSGHSPLLAMVNRSDLATRISALLDSRQRRGRAGALPVALAGAVAAALVLTISPLRMVAAPPNPVVAAEAVPVAQPVDEAEPENAPAAAEPVPVAPRSDEAPQTASPAAQAVPVPTIVTRSALVLLTVTVTDLAGKSIEGLGARDFEVLEDGAVQTITSFEFHKLAEQPGTPDAPSSYYTFGYYPTNSKADGQFRRIQVIDKNDTAAKVRHRPGYYANKESDPPAGTRVIGPAAPLPPGSTFPRLIFRTAPEYSEEARQAKYQGTVFLIVVVSATGEPVNLQVKQSLGLGLDEKAIEAVKQWRFEPGTVNGKPVAMQAEVRLDFRLQ